MKSLLQALPAAFVVHLCEFSNSCDRTTKAGITKLEGYFGEARHENVLMVVPVNGMGTFSTGAPIPLFQIHRRAPIAFDRCFSFSYDVTQAGKRFLVNRYVKLEQVAPLNILLNAAAQPQR